MAEKLVKMVMGDETINVHPSLVKEHELLGWKTADPGAAAEAKAPEEKAEAEAQGAKAVVRAKSSRK